MRGNIFEIYKFPYFSNEANYRIGFYFLRFALVGLLAERQGHPSNLSVDVQERP